MNPNIFLNQTEINSIKNNRQSEITKFITSYVSPAMNTPFQSVTSGGPVRPGGTIHDFWGYLPAPNQNTYDNTDYNAAKNISKSVRDLSLGYAFTNNTTYAKKAIKHLFNWCIKKETYMSSYIGTNLDAVRLWVTIPPLIYGASLTWNYTNSVDGWGQIYTTTINNGTTNTTYAEHFKTWVKNFLTTTKAEPGYGEELPFWRVLNVAVPSAFLNDTTNLTWAFNKWKSLINNDNNVYMIGTGHPCPSTCKAGCNDNNLIVPILRRSTSLSYSTFALQAMGLTAEIAKHHPSLGDDLYHWKTSGGRGIETIWDRIAPYVKDYTTWVCRQDGGLDAGKDVCTYELAYSQFQKQAYKDVLLHWNNTRPRPSYYDSRLLGPITLTHGTNF